MQQLCGRHSDDHPKALELAKGLGNINLALGFTLERLADTPPKPGELGKQFQVKSAQQYLEESSDAYQRALDFRPNDPLLLSSYARVLIKRADHVLLPKFYHGEDSRLLREAEEALDKIAEPDTESGRNVSAGSRRNVKYLFLQRGLFKLYRCQVRGAIRDYQLAIDHDPDCLVAQRNLANAYIKQGSYDQAINVLNRALQNVGQSHEVQMNLEYIHAWLHNSRAWAYFCLSRLRRLQNSLPVFDDSEAIMLLGLASDDLEEAHSLLPPQFDGDDTLNLKMVIDMNKIFIWCEQRLIGLSAPADSDVSASNLVQKLMAFIREYRSCCGTPFRMVGSVDYVRVLIGDYDVKPFADMWRRSTVAARDYQAFLIDIVCLHDYGRQLTVGNLEPVLGPRLLRCIHSIENELNPFYLGLDYIRHGFADYAESCWRRRRLDLQHGPQFYAKDILLYLYDELTSFYFNSGDASADITAIKQRANVFYDSARVRCASGSFNQANLPNFLREYVQLGRALLDNGPLDRSADQSQAEHQILKKKLRAIFGPINKLYDLVNNA